MMKKYAFIILVLSSMFVIVNCPVDIPGVGSGGETTPSTRTFWAQNLTTKTFYQLDADRLASNSICEVWGERGNDEAMAKANSVANAYNTVYAKMMNTFGYQVKLGNVGGKMMNVMEIAHWLPTGKTSGAKLTILLLDIKDGYTTYEDAYVGGYFYAADLLQNDPAHPEIKSNVLDMIYVDTYPSDPGSDSSNETLAHEMQHLMNFVTTLLFRVIENTPYLMNTWIDEGLSTAAEWVYSGTHPEVRWNYYNNDPSKLIQKGNNFYIWNNHEDNPLAILDDYATVYLFFQWLRLQSGNSVLPLENIYREILLSKVNDYTAVTGVAKLINPVYSDWSLLLRDWHAANYTNAPSGLYGYKNDDTLKEVKAPMVPGGTSSVNLYPGEGVYSRTASAESVPSASGNIKYAGLGSTGDPSETTGFVNGARLTYNVDTDLKGSFATGYTTGIAPSPSTGILITDVSGSVQISSNKFSGPYKVDAGYFLRRNGNSGIPDIEKTRNIISKNNSRSIDETTIILEVDRSTIERVFIDE